MLAWKLCQWNHCFSCNWNHQQALASCLKVIREMQTDEEIKRYDQGKLSDAWT